MLFENIRHGKRNEEVDTLLSKIAVFEKVVSSSRPNINISTDSPTRCNQCNKDCLAAYRIMYGIISPILESIKNGQPK